MKKFMPDELKNASLVLILIFLSITIVAGANSENFSIVVLPDTQHYSESYPQIFTNQTRWIVDNRDKLNIKFVVFEGDLVEDANNDTQWIRANESISILDGKIPYDPMEYYLETTIRSQNMKNIFQRRDTRITPTGVGAITTELIINCFLLSELILLLSISVGSQAVMR